MQCCRLALQCPSTHTTYGLEKKKRRIGSCLQVPWQSSIYSASVCQSLQQGPDQKDGYMFILLTCTPMGLAVKWQPVAVSCAEITLAA